MFFNNPQFFQRANHHGRSRTYYYSRGNNYREKQFYSDDDFAKFFFGMPSTSYSVDFSLNDCINIIYFSIY